MKLAARLVILAGVLTTPILANAQSTSAVDSHRVEARYADSLQVSNKYASQDAAPGEARSGRVRVRETTPTSAHDNGAGINGHMGESYLAEVSYSSYSPPIYVAR